MPELLPFLSDKKLFEILEGIIATGKDAILASEANLYSNVVDPFSATIDAMCHEISLEEWLKQESARQCQKTLQNALGDFHQNVLGSMAGWEDLGRGEVVDLRNKSKKILAEVKNKFNTTKGNHKVRIYDDFLNLLNRAEYQAYTCYYVEIIPKDKNIYDKPFTPSDNQSHCRRPENKHIRIIDGKSFYALATGHHDALEKLFDSIPTVAANILGINGDKLAQYREFKRLLKLAYKI